MASGSPARTEDPATRERATHGESTPVGALGMVVLAVRVIALLAALVVFVPLHYLYRIFRYGSPFPMWFLGLAAWIAGARVQRIGTPLRRDVFFVANHVSWIDILALAGHSGTAFVAKAELRDAPVVGWLSTLNRTVFVQRENRIGVAEQINALREALADNWSVTVFPEGTTTDNKSLLPFKTSMLSVLEPPPPGVMVQPVMLDYGQFGEWLGWVGNETGLNNVKRILARPGTFTLDLHFLEPFSPEEFRGRKAIGARARAAIEAALATAHGEPLREFKHDVVPVRYNAPK